MTGQVQRRHGRTVRARVDEGHRLEGCLDIGPPAGVARNVAPASIWPTRCYASAVTSPAASEPACQAVPDASPADRPRMTLRLERRSFDRIDRQTWDRLADANPCATPFS